MQQRGHQQPVAVQRSRRRRRAGRPRAGPRRHAAGSARAPHPTSCRARRTRTSRRWWPGSGRPRARAPRRRRRSTRPGPAAASRTRWRAAAPRSPARRRTRSRAPRRRSTAAPRRSARAGGCATRRAPGTPRAPRRRRSGACRGLRCATGPPRRTAPGSGTPERRCGRARWSASGDRRSARGRNQKVWGRGPSPFHHLSARLDGWLSRPRLATAGSTGRPPIECMVHARQSLVAPQQRDGLEDTR